MWETVALLLDGWWLSCGRRWGGKSGKGCAHFFFVFLYFIYLLLRVKKKRKQGVNKSRIFFFLKVKNKKKGSHSLGSGNDGFFSFSSTFWELISYLSSIFFFSRGLLHTRQFFDFLISHLHQVLLLHTSFFFFWLGFLRHFLLAVFPIKRFSSTVHFRRPRKIRRRKFWVSFFLLSCRLNYFIGTYDPSWTLFSS